MERLSQKSLHKLGSGSMLGLASTTKLNLNVDIGGDDRVSEKDNSDMYKSPSKNFN